MAEAIGYAVGILIAITMVPQMVLSLKTRNVSGLSTAMLLIFFASMVLWTVYGYFIQSYPLIVTNGLATIISAIQVYVKLKYRKTS